MKLPLVLANIGGERKRGKRRKNSKGAEGGGVKEVKQALKL